MRKLDYTDKLDLQVGDRDRIELFSFPDPPARPSYPEAQGLRPLAFAVDDLEAQITALNQQGGNQTYPHRSHHPAALYVLPRS